MVTRKTTTDKSEGESTDEAKKKAAATKTVKKPAAAAPKPKKKSAKKAEEDEQEEEKDLRPYITPPPPKAPVVVAPPVIVAAPPPPAPAAPAAPAAAPAAPEKSPNAPGTPVRPVPPARPVAPARPQFAPRPQGRPGQQPFGRPSFPPRPASSPVGRKAPVPAPRPVEPKPVEVASNGKKKIGFNEMMTVKDLAAAMEAKIPDLIKKLLAIGTPASINQRLDFDTAALVADGFGYEVELKSIYNVEVKDLPEDAKNLKPRPPVVTVMGHVDHGKTSLLDAIRKTSVVQGEAGGITQHIGAYQVKVPKGTITFLDTPGHEAFTAMRARGAMATDIVILVVAADDSVMPQTIEAIDHAKAASVPIVVAINKTDLPTANVQKVKQELAGHGLQAEDWGGKTVMVELSAKTGKNVDKLLEMLLLEAELLELKANPDRPARGIVLEAHLDPRRGNVATILVQSGTLKSGDVVVCGLTSGRVRAMLDEAYDPLDVAGPSQPARLLGLTSVPQVGDQLSVVNSDQEAREIAERRRLVHKDAAVRKSGHMSLENLHSKIAEGEIQDLPIIIKCDVQGSLQAIQDSLGKLPSGSIHIRFVHAGVGNINESDVLLGEASDAIVFGFNVKIEGSAEAEAKKAGVDIRSYKIIYEMLADIRAAMEGLLKPEDKEVVKARAQVKQVFPSSRLGTVAGCMVIEGKFSRGGRARVVRNGQLVGNGPVSSLRRFKDDVKEVEKGYECGISIEGIKTYEPGDIIEAYVIEKVARRLEA